MDSGKALAAAVAFPALLNLKQEVVQARWGQLLEAATTREEWSRQLQSMPATGLAALLVCSQRSCIIVMLAVLLSIPFCMARVPFINRLVGKLAQLMGVATPVPNTHVMKGASGKMLRQLRVSWYQNKVDPEDPEPDMCPICFCEYSPGVALIKLDCDHFFHKECIRKWLKRDATCPMCKTGLTDSRLGVLMAGHLRVLIPCMSPVLEVFGARELAAFGADAVGGA
eukprot:gene9670-9829_t